MNNDLGPPTVPTWLATVVIVVLVVGVVVLWHYSGDLSKPSPPCREESLRTLEAWKIIETPTYGLPSRYVVTTSDSLWSCTTYNERVRCYQLTDCK